MQDRVNGVLKKWFPEKAYGFITPDEGSKDIFVHISAFPQGSQPQEGQRVSFVIGEGPKGINANSVSFESAETEAPTNVTPVDFTPEAEEPMAEAA